jgi:hypothetical protein
LSLRPYLNFRNDNRSLIVPSIQRLSTDLARSSEALKAWGLGEGDDLSVCAPILTLGDLAHWHIKDILSHAATAINYVSNAFAIFAAHQQSAREHMKSIRAREEALDATRIRRKRIGRDADSLEKKVNKMGPEVRLAAVKLFDVDLEWILRIKI